MTISTLKLLLAGATTILLSLLALFAFQAPREAPHVFSSVGQGQAYYSTTTAATIATTPNYNQISTSSRSVSGTLGSCIVVAAGTAGGALNFYDATTSNVNQRASRFGTSSILLASLPTNLAVGTYTFDVQFANGLLMINEGGVAQTGTTTCTYRFD